MKTNKRSVEIFFLFALFSATALRAEPFDVAVPGPAANDPLLLQGDYVAPTQESAPVLVCLHGLGSSREEWAPLRDRAHKRGWGTLAYDLRGHGRSRGTLAGSTVDHEAKQFGRNPAFWQLMPGDLDLVAARLIEKTKLARSRVTLVGASLGANICLIVASRDPGWARVALLSPGLDYAGLATEAPISVLQSPALLIAAKSDAYAFLSAEKLASLAPQGRLTFLPLSRGTPRGDHGVQLFDGKLEEKLLDWIGGISPAKPASPSKPKR